jgi:hypothetical protein
MGVFLAVWETLSVASGAGRKKNTAQRGYLARIQRSVATSPHPGPLFALFILS